ncbi:hypothetical protein RchiOBHm_Chr4g0393141 [Rosa chinensis]|uniref:Uncharacterized protein n=1 Tax=Rosa chinensis TaxID=74649 RepID=A0A2P6QR09_ROSCH|nr:hypothetical protein RchiOBHm_Chr4g0393141 [Rosa chinensis]
MRVGCLTRVLVQLSWYQSSGCDLGALQFFKDSYTNLQDLLLFYFDFCSATQISLHHLHQL